MSERKHTPLPWAGWGDGVTGPSTAAFAALDYKRVPGCVSFKEAGGAYHGTIARTFIGANAAFIVTACNAHYELLEERDELLETLRDLRDKWESFGDGTVSWVAACASELRAAIAKAEPQP